MQPPGLRALVGKLPNIDYANLRGRYADLVVVYSGGERR